MFEQKQQKHKRGQSPNSLDNLRQGRESQWDEPTARVNTSIPVRVKDGLVKMGGGPRKIGEAIAKLYEEYEESQK